MIPPLYYGPEKGGIARKLIWLRLLKIFRSPLKKTFLTRFLFDCMAWMASRGLDDFMARAIWLAGLRSDCRKRCLSLFTPTIIFLEGSVSALTPKHPPPGGGRDVPLPGGMEWYER